MLTNKNRVALWALTAAAAAVLTAAAPAFAETFYVRPDGNDQAAGTSAKEAFRTVLRAAGRLNHGDGIVIAPGVYREAALLAERFSADGAAMSVVGDEGGKAFGVAAGAVVICPAEGAQGAAMEFYRFRNLRIAGLTFRGPGQGLRLDKCKDVLVERCTFTGLTRGLAAESVEGLRVESSVFARCTVGLFLHGVVGGRLAHDSVAGCSSVGVLVLGCGQGAIRNCLLAGNNTSIIADRISAAGWTSDCNVLHGASGPWGDVQVVANVYEWFAASGQDRRSVHVVPAFADAAACDLHVAATVGWGGGLPGMDVGRTLDPKVELDRDARAFRVRGSAVCAGAYDYPDPAAGPAGWAKLGVKLPAADGPRQSAGVYAEDGTLIRTLLADAAGAAELWWDGRDDLGKPAPAGKYVAKTAVGDVRVVDDGAFGDDGNPMGAYHCDNADRVAALADGGFVVTTIYDEGGYPLRRYSSSGQPTFASNLADKDFAAITLGGDDLYAVVGKGAAAAVVRLTLPGNRAKMASGADGYPVFAKDEKPVEPVGLAVMGGKAYVALAGGMDVIRVIDLGTGAKAADWPTPGVGDLAVDPKGTLWAVSGTDVVAIDLSAGGAGKPARRIATGLATPRHLAASADRLAVVDRKAGQVAVIDPAAEAGRGKIIRTIGKSVPAGTWVPVGPDVLCDPRGAALLRDGRLVLTEHARVRILYPDTGVVCQDLLSNFMDNAVVHPTKAEYVYCWPGLFRVDPATGAWQWLVQAPQGQGPPGKDGKPTSLSLGSPSTSVVLGGRAFVAYYNSGHLRMVDVTEPLQPRQALDITGAKGGLIEGWAYSTITFTKGGDLVGGANYKQSFGVAPFTGLDAQNNPTFDFAASRQVGPGEDPSPRGMKPIGALAADKQTGDFYYLAVTAANNKMVPGWGADGTGVGRTTPDGKPLWFAPSSGGNYMSIGAARAADRLWVLAGKSFGGQIDLFDADGLRLATGNWAWPCNYTIGFVDMRFGVQAYVRPDGKVGAYVEDDAIGRFARCRIDGAATLKTASAPVEWTVPPERPSGERPVPERPAAAPAGSSVPAGSSISAGSSVPTPHEVASSAGSALSAPLTIPKVAPLKTDGDWSAWAKAGVVPQIVALPVIGFHRNVPDDLWQTFRQATGIGAIAHDGKDLLVYFLVADDTMHFDADKGGRMWEFDSVELWLEEEQIGLGMVRDGTPTLFKYRHHNRAGKEWSTNYGLPRENVWAEKLTDLSAHPLGKLLQSVTGASLAGRPGYAVQGRIPFAEVKLVGGIAGRTGKDIVDMTGKPGEIIRIGVSFGGICEAGREQDFKVNWPSTMMFSDPTRSTPFVFGQ